ncbi:very short patch repair endonuclease [Cellulomonas sp. Root485]|uniref:very short patch repair endonuclease n=1 Tax=Cellulomonas sp. Root485 TaxID=1736546 RepID=UPI003518625D
MDRWVSTDKGRHLRGRSSRNTAPELALRRELHRRGLRFRLHVSLGRGCNPDLVLPRHRLAVWVDGCFWHGHKSHTWTPRTGPNVALWEAKIDANRARDARALELASAAGWTGVRVWECEIKADVSAAADLVSSRTGAR